MWKLLAVVLVTLVACGSIDAEIAPAAQPTTVRVSPTVTTVPAAVALATATVVPQATATPEPTVDAGLVECITTIAFVASFHEHRITGSVFEEQSFTGFGVELDVKEPRLQKDREGPTFLEGSGKIHKIIPTSCDGLVDQALWRQLAIEYDTTP